MYGYDLWRWIHETVADGSGMNLGFARLADGWEDVSVCCHANAPDAQPRHSHARVDVSAIYGVIGCCLCIPTAM